MGVQRTLYIIKCETYLSIVVAVRPRRNTDELDCRPQWQPSQLCSCLVSRSTQAILVLCRGIFTPQNDVVETKWEHHVFAAVFQPGSGGYPLAGVFAEVGFALLPSSCVCLPSVRSRCSFALFRSFVFVSSRTALRRSLTGSSPIFSCDVLPPTSMGGSQVQEGCADYPRALRAARQAFPFLEPLAR